jgi:hypothetical protein
MLKTQVDLIILAKFKLTEKIGTIDGGDIFYDNTAVRLVVGALMFLATYSCPNISFILGMLS